MAKQGTLRYMSLSQSEAVQFIKKREVLTTGTVLYIASQATSLPDVFYGIGKVLDETPGFNKSTIASVVGLLNGSLTGPHTHIIGDVTNLQSTLDTKSVIGHTHDDRYYTETEIDSTVGGLQTQITALDTGKSNVGHGHVIGDVSGLQTALDDLDSRVTSLENSLYVPGVTAVDEGLI